jgi:hypothetical protein
MYDTRKAVQLFLQLIGGRMPFETNAEETIIKRDMRSVANRARFYHL